MAREWPATTAASLIALIDDPRHKVSSATAPHRLSAEQAKAILDLRLQRLTALGRDEIKDELDKLAAEISDYLEILRSRARIQTIVKDELKAVRDEFATPRRTVIAEEEGEFDDEDLIHREDMVVTVSHQGYIKRVPLSTYRAQRRGGKGRAGMQTREEDFVARLFVASTHAPVLYFSSRGKVYKEKVWKLPVAAPQARGKALINILPLHQDERITTFMPLPEDESTWANLDVMFATTRGTVRRNKLSDFVDVRPSGIIAMKLDEGEAIVDVQICTEKDDVLLTAGGGQCIRFAVPEVRVFQGRTSMGVRGISLAENDKVISMSILGHAEATSEERVAYLRRANAVRRGDGEEETAVVDAEESGRPDRAWREALRRNVGGRAIRADIVGEGLRQAHVVLRIPHHRPRRQRHHRHGHHQEERQDRRVLPGGRGRPDHAGHRWRQADPHAGGGHPHCRPLDAGRDRVRHRDDEKVVSVERLSRMTARSDRMNYELFTAFVLITIVLILTPGPVVTLVIATGATHGVRAALTTVLGTTIGNAILISAIALGLELRAQECRRIVRSLALGGRGLSRLARHSGVARRGASRRRAAACARAFLARHGRGADQSEDHRVFHGVPAAIRRSVLAGGASIICHVCDVYSDRLGHRFRLGHGIGNGARVFHEAVARQIARPHVRRGADRRRHLAVAGAPSGLTNFKIWIFGGGCRGSQ